MYIHTYSTNRHFEARHQSCAGVTVGWKEDSDQATTETHHRAFKPTEARGQPLHQTVPGGVREAYCTRPLHWEGTIIIHLYMYVCMYMYMYVCITKMTAAFMPDLQMYIDVYNVCQMYIDVYTATWCKLVEWSIITCTIKHVHTSTYTCSHSCTQVHTTHIHHTHCSDYMYV